MGKEYFRFFKTMTERSYAVICGFDVADQIVDCVIDSEDEEFYYEYTEAELMRILESDTYFIITRNVYENDEPEWFIETLRNNGVQPHLDVDYVYVEKDVRDMVNYGKIDARTIYIV